VKLSLPLRIFVVHLLFMVAIGALGAWLVQREFERYTTGWEEALEGLPQKRLFSPQAREVARSLLLQLDEDLPPERREQDRSAVGEGLDRVLPTLPSISRFVVLDAEGRVRYANDPTLAIGQVDEERAADLASDTPIERRIRLRSGDEATEVFLPVLQDPGGEPDGEGAPARRLGTVWLRYRDKSPGADTEAARDPARRLNPWAAELAHAMLQELERSPDETLEEYRADISAGLNRIIGSLPIETLVIVDADRRIQYINDPAALDLTFTGEENEAWFASDDVESRRPPDAPETVEEMIPVFDLATAETGGARRRLGSVLIRYRPDTDLLERNPAFRPPSVQPSDYVEGLTLFLLAAVIGGIALAALTGLPVRRLERALSDFRARGYRGGLDAASFGLPKDLATAAEAISELGGRLEALDAGGKERAALLATLSQSLEDGMVAIDPSGTPVAWNPAALRLLGAGPIDGDDPGGPTADAEARSLRAAIERNADLAFAVERADDTETREVEIERDDGTRALARVTRVPFEVRPGEAGTQLMIRDLATLRKVEAHLLEAGRFAVLAHLAASLAHEIRNPLHAIQLNTSVIEQYVDVSTHDKASRAVGESLTTIRDEARRLADLLNNYLGMVRPEAEAGPVDMRDLCRRVIQLVGHTAHKSHVEIRLEGQPDLPMVQGLASRLQQALLNLVLNAIQAMPDGGTVTLHADTLPDLVRITVSDTGPGLPQELADQLFDTRVTTKPDGSGLGLPLVRLIAESHGGGVWYRSAPGEGAAFTLVLPTQPSS
jgi:PAS domain S-box-containing protein